MKVQIEFNDIENALKPGALLFALDGIEFTVVSRTVKDQLPRIVFQGMTLLEIKELAKIMNERCNALSLKMLYTGKKSKVD